MNELNSLYLDYKANVKYIEQPNCGHTLPTDLERNTLDCREATDRAYGISGGGPDGAGEIFKHILPNTPTLNDRALDWESYGELFEFD